VLSLDSAIEKSVTRKDYRATEKCESRLLLLLTCTFLEIVFETKTSLFKFPEFDFSVACVGAEHYIQATRKLEPPLVTCGPALCEFQNPIFRNIRLDSAERT